MQIIDFSWKEGDFWFKLKLVFIKLLHHLLNFYCAIYRTAKFQSQIPWWSKWSRTWTRGSRRTSWSPGRTKTRTSARTSSHSSEILSNSNHNFHPQKKCWNLKYGFLYVVDKFNMILDINIKKYFSWKFHFFANFILERKYASTHMFTVFEIGAYFSVDASTNFLLKIASRNPYEALFVCHGIACSNYFCRGFYKF